MIHEWPSDVSRREPVPPAPRLSRDQKLDLARMTGACILSLAALGAAGWVFACQEDRRAARQDQHHETPPAAVTVRTAEVLAPITTPDLRAAASRPAAERGARAAAAPPALDAPRVTTRRTPAAGRPASLTRRVARFLAGDGRHEPRPFPTIPE